VNLSPAASFRIESPIFEGEVSRTVIAKLMRYIHRNDRRAFAEVWRDSGAETDGSRDAICWDIARMLAEPAASDTPRPFTPTPTGVGLIRRGSQQHNIGVQQ
jgi:hypothetical protein